MASNVITRSFMLNNEAFIMFMKKSVDLLQNDDIAFTPSEYLELIYIMIQNTYSGDVFTETVNTDGQDEFKDYQNYMFESLKATFLKHYENIMKSIDNLGESSIIKLYLSLSLFDQNTLNLKTKFGTKIDKAVAGAIPYVEAQLKASLMIHRARLNLPSKRQNEVLLEDFMDNFDTLQAVFFINTLRFLEIQQYKSDELVERLEEDLALFITGYGLAELTKLAKSVPYYFIDGEEDIPKLIRDKISKIIFLIINRCKHNGT